MEKNVSVPMNSVVIWRSLTSVTWVAQEAQEFVVVRGLLLCMKVKRKIV